MLGLSFDCPFCNKQFNLVSLAKHFIRTHKISGETLYVKLFGNQSLCKCGCNEKTKFRGISKGYATFIHGHHSRVHNNWGHNLEALNKSHKTCRKLRSNGNMRVWNKGHSKETNESVAKYSKSLSDGFTKEKKEKYSAIMSNNRKSGKIRTLRGEEHPQWTGGVSSLQNECRSLLRSAWTYPKLKKANFMCEHCTSRKNLNVHHSNERFSQIVKQIAKKFKWIGDNSDLPKKDLISNEVVQYHIDNNVDGIVLCHDCHIKEHAKFGEIIN